MNSDQKSVCPNFDEINISKLMLKHNLIEKSLDAIISEAKQELSKEEHCTNEYDVMDITKNQLK